MTSGSVVEAYKTKTCNAADLKGLSIEKIQALTSCDALEAYKALALDGNAADLKDLSLESIKMLISPQSVKLYYSGFTTKNIIEFCGIGQNNKESEELLQFMHKNILAIRKLSKATGLSLTEVLKIDKSIIEKASQSIDDAVKMLPPKQTMVEKLQLSEKQSISPEQFKQQGDISPKNFQNQSSIKPEDIKNNDKGGGKGHEK